MSIRRLGRRGRHAQDQLHWTRGACSGWQLSNDLYTFVMVFLGENLYQRRLKLAGFEGNGFQRWKSLYKDVQGGDELIHNAGRQIVQRFPATTSMNYLHRVQLPELACKTR